VSCAQTLYGEGVERCWAKVVKDLAILPDEGLCIEVLNTAGRHGMPLLAADVLRQLELIGVPYQEYHLAPLLEAFVAKGQVKAAFSVLDLFRSSNVPPSLETARPILHVIQRDPDTIDSAFAMLEELHKEGQTVDVVAGNVVIEACVFLNDLQRAVQTFKGFPSIGVAPDVETFNLLFTACVNAEHRDLGERLHKDMQAANITRNADTFKALISLYLTQADYEDAFFYLEEMKAAGHKPAYSVYEGIVRKCFAMGDSRYKLALEECKDMGYTEGKALRAVLASARKTEELDFKSD